MTNELNFSTLKPGLKYICTAGAGRITGDVLPIATLRKGWHATEAWGCWASSREAALSFRTPFPAGTEVVLALNLQVPPESLNTTCVVAFGKGVSAPLPVQSNGSWLLARGQITYEGIAQVTLTSAGTFSRPDSRELFIGLRAIAFCLAEDRAGVETLKRLTHVPRLRQMTGVTRRAISALRRSSGPTTPHGQSAAVVEAPGSQPAGRSVSDEVDRRIIELELASVNEQLAPELEPRPGQLMKAHEETVHIAQLGRGERTHWGLVRTLRGVEAVRGYCLSKTPIVEIQMLINGVAIYRGPPSGGYKLEYEIASDEIRKYVFNIWFDFSDYATGRQDFVLRFIDVHGGMKVHREHAVVIAEPWAVENYPGVDGIVERPAQGGANLVEWINALPTRVRPSRRTFFEQPPRNILVLRVDQLGDMVASVPALKTLKKIFPESNIVALVTTANEGLARTLGVFNEVIVVNFRDDPEERKRVMPVEQQIELKAKLAPYMFDVAIDLAASWLSRPLLHLSGAPFLYGCFFPPGAYPWLSMGIECNTRNVHNGMDYAPHSTRMVGMMEFLGATANSRFEVTRNPALRREQLQTYGIGSADGYAVLHDGARLKFSRWPYYLDLVRKLLSDTDLKIVMFSDDPELKAKLTPDLLQSGRFRFIDGQLPFEDFDALLSFCDVFVGNDSGPKHLASLRGAQVVSIHLARVPWNEWGQEGEGYILSRNVPCAGCAVFHEAEECGADFACIKHISTQDVFGAISRVLNRRERAAAAR